MNMTENEIRFTSRLEALSYLPWLKEQGYVPYQCDRCGLSFAPYNEPSTDFGGILCDQCAEDMAL